MLQFRNIGSTWGVEISDFCGFLNLDKPPGITSRDVVNRVQRPLKRSRVKVGHAGTLDPLATGVLVVAVGAATRLIEYVQRQQKTYRAAVLLGSNSDTDDADGVVTPVEDPKVPTTEAVRAALESQVGLTMQMPPAYSALRVGGERAYDLARAGRSVELAARPVRIDRVTLIRYEWPKLEIEVDCGAGTYIRSIARDVGAMLGCGGLIEGLRRTRIGPFRVEEAIAPDVDWLDPSMLPGVLWPPLEGVADLPRVLLDYVQVDEVRQGKAVDIGAMDIDLEDGGNVALVDPSGALVAIGQADPPSGVIRPRRVLPDSHTRG